MKIIECDKCGVEFGAGFIKRHIDSESCLTRHKLKGGRRTLD